jgi:hypothetical protein
VVLARVSQVQPMHHAGAGTEQQNEQRNQQRGAGQ